MQQQQQSGAPAAAAAAAAAASAAETATTTTTRSSSRGSRSVSVDNTNVTLLARRPTVFVRLRNFPSASFMLPAFSNHQQNNNSNKLALQTRSRVDCGKANSKKEPLLRSHTSTTGITATTSHHQQQQQQQVPLASSCVEIGADGKTILVTSTSKTNYSHVAQQKHSFEFDGCFSALDGANYAAPPSSNNNNSSSSAATAAAEISHRHHLSVPVDDRTIFTASVAPIIKLIVDNEISGLCCCYGATSTGKSALLFGGRRGDRSSVGLVTLSAQQLLRHYDSLFVSCIEVYLDKYYDMLTGKEITCSVTPSQGLSWAALSRFGPIRSTSDLAPFLAACMRQRRVSKTERNERSSRSSAIIHLLPVLGYSEASGGSGKSATTTTATTTNKKAAEAEIDAAVASAESKKNEKDDGADDDDDVKENDVGGDDNADVDGERPKKRRVPMIAERVRLSLVDLAGSERWKHDTTTGTAGGMMGSNTNAAHLHREAASINLALSNLGRTIQQLAELRVYQQQQHFGSGVNKNDDNNNNGNGTSAGCAALCGGGSIDAMCRSSALTWALRDELQLRGAVSFVITVSPIAEQAAETLSSLRFAAMLRAVRQTIFIKPVLSAELRPATAESLYIVPRTKAIAAAAAATTAANVASPHSKNSNNTSRLPATASSSFNSPPSKNAKKPLAQQKAQQQQQRPINNAETQWSPQRAAEASINKNSTSPAHKENRNNNSSSNNIGDASLYAEYMNLDQSGRQHSSGDDVDGDQQLGVVAVPIRCDTELYAPGFEPSPHRAASRSASAALESAGKNSDEQRTLVAAAAAGERLIICALNTQQEQQAESQATILFPSEENNKINVSVSNNNNNGSSLNLADYDIAVIGTRSAVWEYCRFLNLQQEQKQQDGEGLLPTLNVICTLLPERDSSAAVHASLPADQNAEDGAMQQDARRCICATSCFVLSRGSVDPKMAANWWGQFWNRESDTERDGNCDSNTNNNDDIPRYDRLICCISRATAPVDQQRAATAVSIFDTEGVAIEIRNGDSFDLAASTTSRSSHCGDGEGSNFLFLQMRAVLHRPEAAPLQVPLPPMPKQTSKNHNNNNNSNNMKKLASSGGPTPRHSSEQRQSGAMMAVHREERGASALLVRSFPASSPQSAAAFSSSSQQHNAVFFADPFDEIPFVESGPGSAIAAAIKAGSASSSPRPHRARSTSSSAASQHRIPDFPPLVPRDANSRSTSNNINNDKDKSRSASSAPATEPSPTRPTMSTRNNNSNNAGSLSSVESSSMASMSSVHNNNNNNMHQMNKKKLRSRGGDDDKSDASSFFGSGAMQLYASWKAVEGTMAQCEENAQEDREEAALLVVDSSCSGSGTVLLATNPHHRQQQQQHVRSVSLQGVEGRLSRKSSVLFLGKQEQQEQQQQQQYVPGPRASSATLAMSQSPESLLSDAKSNSNSTAGSTRTAASSKQPSVVVADGADHQSPPAAAAAAAAAAAPAAAFAPASSVQPEPLRVEHTSREPSPRNPNIPAEEKEGEQPKEQTQQPQQQQQEGAEVQCDQNGGSNSNVSIPAEAFLQRAAVSRSVSWQEELHKARGRAWFAHKSKSASASAASSSSRSSANRNRGKNTHNNNGDNNSDNKKDKSPEPRAILRREDSQLIVHPDVAVGDDDDGTFFSPDPRPTLRRKSKSSSTHRVFKNPLAAIHGLARAPTKKKIEHGTPSSSSSFFKMASSVSSFLKQVVRTVAPTTSALATGNKSLQETLKSAAAAAAAGTPTSSALPRMDSLRLKNAPHAGANKNSGNDNNTSNKKTTTTATAPQLPTAAVAAAQFLAKDVRMVSSLLFGEKKSSAPAAAKKPAATVPAPSNATATRAGGNTNAAKKK